jgi:hypothetical protein
MTLLCCSVLVAGSVLVVVIAVWCMPVPVVVVVDVVAVCDLVVPAVRAVHVLVRWVRHVR